MIFSKNQEGSKSVNKQAKYYLFYKSEGMQWFSSSIVEERFSCCTFFFEIK